MVEFGPEAAIADELAWRTSWYDHVMKGKPSPFAKKVRYFTMGTGDGHKTPDGKLFHGGQWHETDTWPPAGTESMRFYLGGDGVLSTKKQSGSSSYTFDPKNPVPTIGGNISSGDGIMLQGAWDQRGGPHVWNWQQPLPLSARNDVLVFQTAPLEHDIEVTGELGVKLWVSSDCVDTDFTAKLIDVHPASADWPGGFDLNIADGICRARFRDSLKEEKLMKPGEIYPLSIRLYPTSNVFKKGHRIRVDISSSNFPRFDVNPNTGEPLQQHRSMKAALNKIHHDAEHPSQIVLPVLKTSK
jgi:putative CocE/NonD family hydrolase